MNAKTKFTLAAAIATTALSTTLFVGCQSVPDHDAAGGILAGNEFSQDRATRGTSLDHSIVGTGSGSSIDSSQSAAGPMSAGGVTTAGGGPSRAANTTAPATPVAPGTPVAPVGAAPGQNLAPELE